MSFRNDEMNMGDKRKRRPGRIFSVMVLVLALVGTGGAVKGKTSVAQDVEAPVQKAIDTHQAAQKAQEKWDEERTRLAALYDRLKADSERLTAERDQLFRQAAGLKTSNLALAAEKMETLRIQSEMLPFLKTTAERLKALVAGDPPFLTGERTIRLTKLSAVLEDPEVSVAEKYRKTMEALFVEAEYGNTVEVYQEKIILDDAEVLGNIFRLGRISLFFLSLDRERAAVFNVAQNLWTGLEAVHIPAIEGVVEMAAKHRPMEVISLPIGGLAVTEGGGHE